MHRPASRIVCLCGSTRFKDAFESAEQGETLAGRIVLTVGFFEHADGIVLESCVADRLARLHDEKIALADEILVIDVGGYIGDATRHEIAVAENLGKRIRYWSAEREAASS
jgi:hypothetical protein